MVVLDVRSVERFRTGHIIGARSLPLDDLDSAADKHGKYRDKPVLVYDENGLTVSKAAAKLRALAFTQVFSLKGGMMAWQRENYPTQKGK